MLRRQPEKLLLNADDVAAITNKSGAGETAIAVIPNFGEIDCSKVVSWTTSCQDEGTAKEVRVCFDEPGESCECPSCISIEVVILPDLTLYTTDETFEVRRVYEYCSPNGGPIVLQTALEDIADQITNDLYFKATAEVTDGSGGCDDCDSVAGAIVITGYTGQNYDVYSADTCMIETETDFARPFLSETDLKRLFPIKPGAFGSSPARDKIACGGCYCVDIAVIKHTDVQDIDSTNVENYLEEVYIYSPCEDDSSSLKLLLDSFVVDGAGDPGIWGTDCETVTP